MFDNREWATEDELDFVNKLGFHRPDASRHAITLAPRMALVSRYLDAARRRKDWPRKVNPALVIARAEAILRTLNAQLIEAVQTKQLSAEFAPRDLFPQERISPW